MASPDAPGTTILRESWQARIYNAVLITAFMWGVLILQSDGTAAIVFTVFWGLLVIGELYRLYRPVAVLTPAEILVNNMRPRKVPWAEIRDVSTVKRLGTQRIVLTLRDDSRLLMEAPTAFFLGRAKLDKAVTTIRAQWVANRGAGWKAPEPAAPAESGQSTEGGTTSGLSKG